MTAKQPPSAAFAGYIIEQLDDLGNVTMKRFFSGTSLSIGDLQLGFVSSEETLYLRLSTTDRAELEGLGGEPFSCGRKMGKTTFTPSYFSLPAEIIDDREAINHWCRRAYTFARETYKPKKPRA